MNSAILYRIGWRHLLRHPWQTILMILGITLGVAVVVAIDLANASASRAFNLSTEAVVGRATHQIVGGPNRLSETIYVQLKQNGLPDAAAPVISEFASSPQLGNRSIQLLGVDPFAETPFRDYLKAQNGIPVEQLSLFLTKPGAIFISADLARQYNLELCTGAGDNEVKTLDSCQISLEIGGQRRSVFIAGLLEPADSLSERALNNLILADISTAQEITGRVGLVDRIDLILDRSCADLKTRQACPTVEQIRSDLPADAQVQTVEARAGAVEQMTAAFQLNLTALSLLALVVGMFLIYNTMTFSVVQRREHFGTLRCLGVTRREIFAFVAGEALAVGVIGAMLGVTVGTFMGQGAIRLVTQTINDLFFVLTVQGVQIPVASLIKGGLLGLVATFLSVIPPAWEAASVTPRMALTRSSLETKVERWVLMAAATGLILLILGTIVLLSVSNSLLVSFAATFVIIVGFAMVAPFGTKAFMQAATPLMGSVMGSVGKMAPRDVVNTLSRTSVAIAALMVAVSVTIGVSLMVSSFRHTVVTWLEQTLQGDIYISPPGLTASQPSAPLDPDVLPVIRQWPGVARADVLRSVTIDSPSGPVHIAATDNPTLVDERIYVRMAGTRQEIDEALLNGAVLISEPFANRMGISRFDDSVALDTARGPHRFPIVGIYYDYASTQGTVLMRLATYRSFWDDDTLTAIALRLNQGVDPDRLSIELQRELQPLQQLQIRPNRALREDVLVVFDRTFAITGALQFLATLVAFIGVLSALLSLQLERQREMGILRAIGMTTQQMRRLILMETGLMGSVAGVLAMPSGFALAVILIYIINRRSFGWTLLMEVEALPFIQAFFVAFLAAILAGIYPAIRMSRSVTAQALRSE
ncbi:MAG TPA: FtsX-like permease family protein [Anaerolineales bacterium]